MPDLDEANIFFDKLNSCHRNLKFTMEIAEQNAIPFFGMNITKSGNRLETSVYRKSTMAYFCTTTAMWTNVTKTAYSPL